jgi:hypothetical protein
MNYLMAYQEREVRFLVFFVRHVWFDPQSLQHSSRHTHVGLILIFETDLGLGYIDAA